MDSQKRGQKESKVPILASGDGIAGETAAALGRPVERLDPAHAEPADGARRGEPVLLLYAPDLRAADLRRWIRACAEAEAGPAPVVLARGDRPRPRAEWLALGARAVVARGAPAAELVSAVDRAAAARVGPHRAGGPAEPDLADFPSRSPRMRAFLDLVARVVDGDSSLLITGETGVGKEHLARAIHGASGRRDGPFVAVNCGALPESLLESELFGHEPGAFTGAHEERSGRFEQAGGGSIFLDEIGEMPRHLQVNLLSVLQRREIRRLGSTEARRVDVRVMAASNRDLENEVERGRFREDLYYRLHVVPLDVPPLRRRREDIPDLVGVFLRHFRDELDRRDLVGLRAAAFDRLMRHDWPGNVRELINAVERAVLLGRGPRIEVADLPAAVRGEAPEPPAPERPGPGLPLPAGWDERPWRDVRDEVLAALERRYLERVLARCGGRVGDTARAAGMSTRALYAKMRRHRLDKSDFR